MKIKITSDPDTEIQKFAEKYGLEMEVFKGTDKFIVGFTGVDVQGPEYSIHTRGYGTTMWEAIDDYVKKISDKILVFNHEDWRLNPDNCWELSVPKLV